MLFSFHLKFGYLELFPVFLKVPDNKHSHKYYSLLLLASVGTDFCGERILLSSVIGLQTKNECESWL